MRDQLKREQLEGEPSTSRAAGRWATALLLSGMLSSGAAMAAESASETAASAPAASAPAASAPTAMPAASAASTSAPAASDAATAAKALRTMDEFTGRNALGVTVGIGSGTGISYRRYFNDRIAARGVGYLLYVKDALSLYHFGVSGQVDIRRDERFVIYGLAGVSFAQATTYTDSAPAEGGEDAGLLNLNLGVFPNAGVGLEWGSHSHAGFVLQGELVLTGLIANGGFVRLLPLPQIGVQYLF